LQDYTNPARNALASSQGALAAFAPNQGHPFGIAYVLPIPNGIRITPYRVRYGWRGSVLLGTSGIVSGNEAAN